jgi:hypothetical protein
MSNGGQLYGLCVIDAFNWAAFELGLYPDVFAAIQHRHRDESGEAGSCCTEFLELFSKKGGFRPLGFAGSALA